MIARKKSLALKENCVKGNMDINWTQVFAQALSTAVIVPVTAITTFIVMRYFPLFWVQIENSAKNIIKKGTNGIKKSS
jgi:hypothetical protein